MTLEVKNHYFQGHCRSATITKKIVPGALPYLWFQCLEHSRYSFFKCFGALKSVKNWLPGVLLSHKKWMLGALWALKMGVTGVLWALEIWVPGALGAYRKVQYCKLSSNCYGPLELFLMFPPLNWNSCQLKLFDTLKKTTVASNYWTPPKRPLWHLMDGTPWHPPFLT